MESIAVKTFSACAMKAALHNAATSVNEQLQRCRQMGPLRVVALLSGLHLLLSDDFVVQAMVIISSFAVFYSLQSMSDKRVRGSAAKSRKSSLLLSPPWRKKIKETTVKETTVNPRPEYAFKTHHFDAQVDELVRKTSPSHVDVQVMRRIVALSEERVLPILPTAELRGFVNGDLDVTMFGVSVPQIEIVFFVSHEDLVECVRRFRITKKKGNVNSDGTTTNIEVSAFKAIGTRLMHGDGFRFRRSFYNLCHIILMAPVSLGAHTAPVPISFYLNSTIPLRSLYLTTECEKMFAQAKALFCIVRRWAKVRGISQQSKGFLAPYAWNVLVMYGLQVREEPLVAPFASLALPWNSKLPEQSEVEPRLVDVEADEGKYHSELSTATLFREFFRFYASFDWRGECVSLRSSERAAPTASFPKKFVRSESNACLMTTPCIEDPFEPGTNLGIGMSGESVARFVREFERGEELCCSEEGAFDEVMKAWYPTTTSDQEDQS